MLKRFTTFAVLTLFGLSALGYSQGTPSSQAADSPLAPFERLIGGKWQIGPLTHVFEWGIGKQTVLSRSFDQQGNLAAEARWFWHPGEKVIRGYSIDAAGQFFAEMTTRFQGDKLENHLLTISPDGTRRQYVGIWKFPDDDHYHWTLFEKNGEDLKESMTATAERKR